MPVIIQMRRDTAANWTANNPTLAEGEIGYETDTVKFKFGDGVTAWNGLAYFTVTAGDDDAFHDNVANEITAVANKAVPVDYDVMVIEDSEAAFVKKEVELGDLATALAALHAITEHSDVSLADPGDDGIIYWDDSDGQFQFLWPTTGLSISGDELVFDHTLFADLDLSTYGILLDPDPADHAASGYKVVYTAGENLVFGNLVYMKAADGKMWKAQANAEATCHVSAIALATIAADATGLFLTYGIIEDADFNFTIGANVWLDDDTAGLATATQPADSGDMVISVGQCQDHADRMLFNPDKTWIELA